MCILTFNHVDEGWSDFVLTQAKEWQKVIHSWMIDDLSHPVLAVKYEDLRLDTAAELKRVLDFLQVPYSSFIVEELTLTIKEDKPSIVYMYTPDQINCINTIIKSTIERLAVSKVDVDYLSSYLKL